MGTTDPTTRTPYAHKIRYGVTGAPHLPNPSPYFPDAGVIPTLVELVYSAARPGRRAYITASVTGWGTLGGEPQQPERQVTQHYSDGPAGWPEWLAAEALLHAPENWDCVRGAAGPHRPPCTDGDHCGEPAHCPPSFAYARLQAVATSANREMAGATLRAYQRVHRLARNATAPLQPSEVLEALKDPEPGPSRLLASLSADRVLTPDEHDRAWHAIEGADDPDPGSILAAVLRALNIAPPPGLHPGAPVDDPTRPHTPGRPSTGPVSGPVVPPDTSGTLDTLTIHAGDGQPPLVTLNLSSGVMEFGPGYTPDAAAEAFWDAVDEIGLAPARRDRANRALRDRAWRLVADWRTAAAARGEDPYSDPYAQQLAAALTEDSPAGAGQADHRDGGGVESAAG